MNKKNPNEQNKKRMEHFFRSGRIPKLNIMEESASRRILIHHEKNDGRSVIIGRKRTKDRRYNLNTFI